MKPTYMEQRLYEDTILPRISAMKPGTVFSFGGLTDYCGNARLGRYLREQVIQGQLTGVVRLIGEYAADGYQKL